MFRVLAGVVLAVQIMQGGAITISPSLKNASVGGFFNLDIVFSSAVDLYAYQFDLAFNPALLQATQITEGGLLSNGGATFYIPGVIDNVGGAILSTADSLQGPVSGVSGTGTLASITFQAVAIGSTPVTIFNTFFLDSNFSSIPADISSGTVNVNAPEPSSLPIALTGLAVLFGLKVCRRARQAS